MFLSIVVFAFVVVFAPPARMGVRVLLGFMRALAGAIGVTGCRCRSHARPPEGIVGTGHTHPLVGVELVHVPYFTEGPPHLLYDLHVLECRL
jgi:hypothetical protein